MKEINLILMGYGTVGRAFLRLVAEKNDLCRDRYGLDFKFSAIFEIDGALVYPLSLGMDKILADLLSVSSFKLSSYWNPGFLLTPALDSSEPGVLVECTPTNSKTGIPGLNHIRQALDKRWHVVTANKGPLVVDFGGLMERSKENCVSLKISGATAAALPTLDVALYSLAGTEITYIEGILNGTSNYVLTQMREGQDYEVALKEAQDKGIAEPDPSLDVEGWDTVYKILLIANAVFNTTITISQVKREGITDISSKLLREGRQKDKKLKLLGILSTQGKTLQIEVRPAIIDDSNPLFSVDGTNKGISFTTDTMSVVTVTGGKSDPRGAAAALLKDIINIYCK